MDARDGSAIKGLLAGLERLDVLINAAGVIRRDAEHDPEIFAETIAINLTGTMRTCTAAKAKLASAQGCVVNIASMLTFFGGARVPGYAASKGGVGQLTKSLAAAWASENVRVNAVAPGPFESQMTKWLLETFKDQIEADCPLGRIGSPEDMAGVAIYLASRAGAYVNGVVIPVDGGICIT